MASALFTTNGTVQTAALAVAPAASVALALVDTNGVHRVSWRVKASHASFAVEPTLTPAGYPSGVTATLVMANLTNQSFMIECIVNGGKNARGEDDDRLVRNVIIGCVNSQGFIPFVVGEELERQATHGTTELLNEILDRAGSGGGGASNTNYITNGSDVVGETATDALNTLLTTTVALTASVIAGAGLIGGGAFSAGNPTLNVGAHADGSISVAADTVQVGVLATDTQHGVRGGGTQHAVATTTVAGFMSASDKTKLNGIEAGAEVNVVTSVFGRTGAVVAVAGDYTSTHITNASGVDGATVTIALNNLQAAIEGVEAAAITVHNDLTGRDAADAHSQYLLLSGASPMAGALNMGTFAITNVGLVDGVDVSNHSARHMPGGADALTVGTPVTIGTTNAIGSVNSFSRSDHVHAHGNQAGGTLHAVATALTAGFMSAAHFSVVDGLPANSASAATVFTAGAGLTGGGSLAANRTFNVGANADGSIAVNADDIQVGVLATDAQHGNRGGGALHSGATTTNLGFVQLAGDLNGTATNVSVRRLYGATVPAGSGLTIGRVLLVTGATALGYGLVDSASIAAGAVDATHLAPGGAGNVLIGGASSNSWAQVTNTHVSNSAAIAVTKLAAGAANTVLTGGTSNTFTQITNSHVSNSAAIAVTKLATGTTGDVLAVVGGVPTWREPGIADYPNAYLLDGSRAITAALNANGQNIAASSSRAGTVYAQTIDSFTGTLNYGYDRRVSQSVAIADGAIDVSSSYVLVSNEGAAPTDILHTITGDPGTGAILYLRQSGSSQDITIQDGGTGNIRTGTGSDLTLTSSFDTLVLIRISDFWVVIGRYAADGVFRSVGGVFTGDLTVGGTINGVSLTDHSARHLPGGADALTVAAPVSIGTANAIGSVNAFSRSDHVHAHANQAGGSLHAVVTTTVAGFASAADKVKLNGIEAGAQVNTVTSVFGRTGAVTATSGDYSTTLISNATTVAGANLTVVINSLATATDAAYLINGTRALTAALNVNGQNIGTTSARAGVVYTGGVNATEAVYGAAFAGVQTTSVLVNGTATINSCNVRIDTQGGAAADDWDGVTFGPNVPEGSLILVRIADSSRDVTALHQRTPAGTGAQIFTPHGRDISLLGTVANAFVCARVSSYLVIIGAAYGSWTNNVALLTNVDASGYVSIGANAATSGAVRLPNESHVVGRTTGGANVELIGLNSVSPINRVEVGGTNADMVLRGVDNAWVYLSGYVYTFAATSFAPFTDADKSLGTSTRRWSTVYTGAVDATGEVSAASVAATGAVTAASVSATGIVSGSAFAPATTTAVLSGGVLTINSCRVAVDTEGGAAADDWNEVVFGPNVPVGAMIIIEQVASSRDVTIRHDTEVVNANRRVFTQTGRDLTIGSGSPTVTIGVRTGNYLYISSQASNGWSAPNWPVVSLDASQFVSVGATPPTTGGVRLTNNTYVTSRTTGGANVELVGINTGNLAVFGGSNSNTILSGQDTAWIYIGGSSAYSFTAARLAPSIAGEQNLGLNSYRWDTAYIEKLDASEYVTIGTGTLPTSGGIRLGYGLDVTMADYTGGGYQAVIAVADDTGDTLVGPLAPRRGSASLTYLRSPTSVITQVGGDNVVAVSASLASVAVPVFLAEQSVVPASSSAGATIYARNSALTALNNYGVSWQLTPQISGGIPVRVIRTLQAVNRSTSTVFTMALPELEPFIPDVNPAPANNGYAYFQMRISGFVLHEYSGARQANGASSVHLLRVERAAPDTGFSTMAVGEYELGSTSGLGWPGVTAIAGSGSTPTVSFSATPTGYDGPLTDGTSYWFLVEIEGALQSEYSYS